MIPAELLTQIGLWAAAALTLVTLSYIFGDHPIFRIVLHIFIGAAAGYAGAIAVQDIILPQLIFPAVEIAMGGSGSIDMTEFGIRMGLSLLLLTKLSPRTARFGNPVTAMLVGAGAALAIGGALQGTLLPQINASAQIFDVAGFDLALQGGYYGESISIILQGLLAVLAMLSTLAYFHFGAEARGKQAPLRNILVDVLAWAGSIFIAITLASLFTGVLLSGMGALTERLDFLRMLFTTLTGAG